MPNENMVMGGISFGGCGSVVSPSGGGGEGEPGQETNTNAGIILKRPVTSSSENDSFQEQINRCSSEASVFYLLIKRLRCYQDMPVGDSKLFSGLIDAAQYIQILCQNNKDSQDQLRSNGVLGTLVDTFIAVFHTYLENRVSPLTYAPLMRCWCQISSALWHSVDNPTNPKNQEVVLGKLLAKRDFKIIDFVLKASHSIEKQTEAYVIPIIQLFKGLIDDNLKNQEILSSQKQFVLYLTESFRLRLELKHFDALMWKSIDLMAWLLSLILQYENTTSANQGTADGQNAEKLDMDKKLCNLIKPCCDFLNTNEDEEQPQSVGILLFLACVFSRNVETVHRFNNCRGNDLIVKMHGTDHPQTVKDALRVLMTILKYQNKLLRQEPISRRRQDCDTEGQSSSSIHTMSGNVLPYAGPTYPNKSTGVNSSTTSSSPPVQVVPNASWIEKNNICKAWVEHARTASVSKPVTRENNKYKVQQSSENFYYPSPPPPSVASESEFSTSISKCRPHSVLLNPSAPANLHTGNYRACSGNDNPENKFQPPRKVRRVVPGPINCGTRPSERRPRDDDAASLISITFPKNSAQQKRTKNNTSSELSQAEVAKILGDLRPCKVMETNDNLVVFCTPPEPQTHESSSMRRIDPNQYNNYQNQSTPRSSESKKSTQRSTSSSTGFFGSVVNWLFK